MPVALLGLAGCGGGDDGPVVPQPVTGKVYYDGKPAVGVKVFLIPTDAPMVPRIPQNPHGITGPDGSFSITTFKDGDGAAEGGYQVVLMWPPDESKRGTADEESETDRLQGWYDGTHSTLNVRIKAGTNDIPTYNLPKRTQPPQPSQGVPGRN
jgi:hypothetical protein